MKAKTTAPVKPAPQKNKTSKTTVFFIGLSVVLVAVILVLFQEYSYMDSKRTAQLLSAYSKITDLEEEIKQSRATMGTSQNIPDSYNYKDRALTERSYEGKVYKSYQLDTESYTEDGLDFTIENGDVALVLSNFYGQDFTSNMMFDFARSKMYVIDWKNNSLDVYSMTEGTPEYAKSLKLPMYKTGSLYGIECDGNECIIATAFHQEAGCRIPFNALSESFGTPECGGGYSGETYTPEKI